jgi:type II secretory pathway pseudopilin PulG
MTRTRKLTQSLRRHNTRSGKVLVGCLIALGVVLLIVIGIGVFIATSWKGWTASATEAIMTAALAETALPAAEQTEMMTQFERITGAFRDGDITTAEFGEISQSIMESPILAAAEIQNFQNSHLTSDVLDETNQQIGRVAYDRLARGIIDGQVDRDAFNQTVENISNTTTDEFGDTETEIKPVGECTAEELMMCILKAEEIATGAGVPEAVEPVDLSDEMQAIIDDALGS